MDVEIDGSDAYDASRRMRQLQLVLSDFRPFWPMLVPMFVRWMGQQFASEGAFLNGARWVPLSPTYAAYKAVRYPGRSILYAEGDMRRAASMPQRVENTPTRFTLRIQDPKIGFHQAGDGVPVRKVLPARLPRHALDEVHDLADDYVSDVIRRLGF